MTKASSVSVRVITIAALVLMLSGVGAAQEQSSWNFYESLQGSTNSGGQVFKLNTDIRYSVNQHFDLGGGVPFYFVRNTSDSTTSPSGLQTGIGNAYVDMRLKASGPVTFISTVTGTAPTGDRDKGFSTGKVAVDWNNYLAVPLSRVTPYINAGVANTVSDTAFFVRPFTSSGVVGHFEGGINVPLARYFSIGSSAYAIAPSGEQQIVSRVARRVTSTAAAANAQGRGSVQSRQPRAGQIPVFETGVEAVGGADLASDHGFSGWMELTKDSNVYFQLGYSRSVRYQLNSVSFSVGFNVSSLVRQHRP